MSVRSGVRLLPIATALSVLVACSSTPPEAQTQAGEATPSQGSSSSGEGRADGNGRGTGKGRVTDGRQGEGNGPASEDGGSSGHPAGEGDGKGDSDEVANGFSSEKDAYDSESHGDVPGYAEIVRATVEGEGAEVRLTLVLAEPVPQQMPDNDTFISVSFEFEWGDGNEIDVYADGDSDGWVPGIEGRDDFPGRFSLVGRKVTFAIPWESLGGARAYKWHASDSWVHSGLIRTSYSFDEVPNLGRARYP